MKIKREKQIFLQAFKLFDLGAKIPLYLSFGRFSDFKMNV